MISSVTLMTIFGARACLTGVLQVPGNSMGPAVAHGGSVNIRLRYLDVRGRTIRVVVGARCFGAGAGAVGD